MSNNSFQPDQAKSAGHTELEIHKYLQILKKRKGMIILFSFIFFVLWLAYLITFQNTPVYSSTALLSFQDVRSMSAVNELERSTRNASKASLITTNLLIGKLVEKLQMNISIVSEDIKRTDIFAFTNATRASAPGSYKIVKGPDKFKLLYNPIEGVVADKEICSFAVEDTVKINNMEFQLNRDFMEQTQLKEFEFNVKVFDFAIDQVRKIIKYDLDRSQTILQLTAYHFSPNAAAKIVNTLADLFIELNLKMSRYRSDEVLKILEEQLNVARAELDEASDKLLAFRKRNPWVVLTTDARLQIDNIHSYEQEKVTLEQKNNDIKRLINNLSKSGDISAQNVQANELIAYLEKEGYPLATAFSGEFSTLVTERNTLLATYASSHPYVQENERKLRNQYQKIIGAAQDHVKKLEEQLTQLDNKVNTEKYKLNALPSKSLILADLVRNEALKNSLYTSILSRYNQAKIEREVEVSNIFIVDYGTPPAPDYGMSSLILKAIMGIFFSIGGAMGLAFIVDFFDKTAENAQELEDKLVIPVLGSIPIINVGEKEEVDEVVKGKPEPKLVTQDYSPTFESEAYRDLRTKVIFMNQKSEISSLILTSLWPGEGKSLTAANLAITMAQQKIPTLLVDADLRRGVLHNILGNRKKPGVSDLLVSTATIDKMNVEKIIQSTFIPNLSLISSGMPIPNPTELIGGDRMNQLIRIVTSHFGMVLVDTPPLQVSSDAAILARQLDGVLTVIKAGTTNIDHLNRKIREYPKFFEKVVGAVLNMVKMDTAKNKYHYSYYNY